MARSTTPAPAHLVPVALILLIWHGLLGADYVIARFGLGQADWPALMATLPLGAIWLQVAWGLGVWLGVAAALFLALKDDASVLLFFAAAMAEVVLAVPLFGAVPPALLAALVLVPLAGWFYARALNRRGALH